MNGEALSFDVATWEAVLGPRPHSSGGYSPFESASWPDEDEGPVDGVFWLRWIADQLQKVDASPSAAKALRLRMREQLNAGTLRAVALHPRSGQAWRLPKSAWDAVSARWLWWTGEYVGEDETRRAIYVIQQVPPPPAWWPGPEEPLKKWCAPAGEAEDEARSRLTARSAAVTDRAICRELSEMWQEAGRKGGAAGTINTTRHHLR